MYVAARIRPPTSCGRTIRTCASSSSRSARPTGPRTTSSRNGSPALRTRSGPFSAVAYYFGLELHKRLGVPVGLIESAWGGTDIEPWTPPVGFAAVPEVKPLLDEQAAKYAGYRDELAKALPAWETWVRETPQGAGRQGRAAGRARAGLSRPIPYDNPAGADDPLQRHDPRPDALRHPRRHLVPGREQPERRPLLREEDGGPHPRLARGLEARRLPLLLRPARALQLRLQPRDADGRHPRLPAPAPTSGRPRRNALRIPNTGMAVITDIADLNDIHPTEQEGRRLPAVALGPGQDLRREDARLLGAALQIHDRRRRTSSASPSTTSAAGSSRTTASRSSGSRSPARTASSTRPRPRSPGDTVVVWSPRVPAPKAVRFGWHQLAVPNLANKEGLPASPFRTDKLVISISFLPNRHAAARRPGRAGGLEVRLELLQIDLDRRAHLLEELLEAVGRDLVVALGRRRDRPGRVELGADPVHERRQRRLRPPAAASESPSEDHELVLDARLDGAGRFGQLRVGLRACRAAPSCMNGRFFSASSAAAAGAHHRPLQLAGLLLERRAAPPCPSRAAWPGRAIRRRTSAARRAASATPSTFLASVTVNVPGNDERALRGRHSQDSRAGGLELGRIDGRVAQVPRDAVEALRRPAP